MALREERLRTTSGLRGSPALALSAWRGRSGRRYVVGVHPLTAAALEDLDDAVVLAVRRDAAGFGEIVAAATTGPHLGSGGRTWVARMQKRGANELHVHRLAEDEDERNAVSDDLTEQNKAGA